MNAIDKLNVLNEDLIEDFPILATKVNGCRLAYLDNAASTQVPNFVLDKMSFYQQNTHSNIHRAVHMLSEKSTKEFEDARLKVKNFINADKISEIIFTKGTTSSINMVANSFVKNLLNPGDEVLISYLEHHSNIVPWQIITKEKKANLKVIPMNYDGELVLEDLEKLVTKKTKFISISHVSNALGTVTNINKIIAFAKSFNIPVLVDAAQSVPHQPLDVKKIDCDFLVFSGHKMCAPTGIGILYGKENLLSQFMPYESGGDMILSVTFEKTVYNQLPYYLEAGTPPISQAIALGYAIDYLCKIGLENIHAHEQKLYDLAISELKKIQGVKIYGNSVNHSGVISFTIDGVHPHDIGTLLNEKGVAIRTGHHCAQPVMNFYKIAATARASFYFYNNEKDIHQLVDGINYVKKIFD